MNRAVRIFVFLACVWALIPVVWCGLASLKSSEELARIPGTLLPADFTLQHYIELFTRRPFAAYYLNSLVVSSLSAFLCVAAAGLASYRLARSPKRFRSAVSSSLLVMAFFPPIVLLFPVYEIVRMFGLVNQPWGLILPYAALNLPFAIWLLTGYMELIPYELEEAAAVDGLGPFDIFRRIVAPLAMPAMTSAFLLVFIFSWNEFMFALTFMNLESSRTLTAGMATLSGAFSQEIPWGLLAAGVMASTIPLILAVFVFQKKIVAGLTAGGIKE